MRVYLPCTLAALAAAVEAGELGPAPLTGYAVTPALIEWYASGDTEELEYVALTDAARASLRMLAAERGEGGKGAPRRVVVAAEVPERSATVGTNLEDRARVRLAEPIPLAKVAAVHIDDEYAVPDIEAAIAALPASDEGDDDARFTVDGAEAHELMWYATQEIPDLLRS
ncbi:hypothetical protein BKM31_38515 [[Actinomadura] parvosata subsp. kistnae]|uniref:Uncharacterized protein n=2 Tax=Nonomuraea TaxID=83681 RepID=A0A1V0A8N4_9ACTN|nr:MULTISPECIES: hypothetical protein [unclassified Nonomuraea]AQZ66566.1 hypothetical protein BKM31_38515 [Nonomuraea sp. ATCC 55076]NJP93284.1 hypothetical protein [Nonomuraea sp. FMUSA5-5]